MELLIVLSILAILMALLAPSLGRVKITVRRIICGSNMRQLTYAWGKYALEKKQLPVSNTSGAEAWVRMGDYGNTEQCVTQGALWPYVQELALYRCPGSAYDYYVSYGLSGLLRGEASMAANLGQVRDHAATEILSIAVDDGEVVFTRRAP